MPQIIPEHIMLADEAIGNWLKKRCSDSTQLVPDKDGYRLETCSISTHPWKDRSYPYRVVALLSKAEGEFLLEIREKGEKLAQENFEKKQKEEVKRTKQHKLWIDAWEKAILKDPSTGLSSVKNVEVRGNRVEVVDDYGNFIEDIAFDDDTFPEMIGQERINLILENFYNMDSPGDY
jgi:hypothetical protein